MEKKIKVNLVIDEAVSRYISEVKEEGESISRLVNRILREQAQKTK